MANYIPKSELLQKAVAELNGVSDSFDVSVKGDNIIVTSKWLNGTAVGAGGVESMRETVTTIYTIKDNVDLLPRLKPWDSWSELREYPCPRKGCLRLPDITFALYKQLGYSPSFQAFRALRFIGILIRRPEPFTKRT